MTTLDVAVKHLSLDDETNPYISEGQPTSETSSETSIDPLPTPPIEEDHNEPIEDEKQQPSQEDYPPWPTLEQRGMTVDEQVAELHIKLSRGRQPPVHAMSMLNVMQQQHSETLANAVRDHGYAPAIRAHYQDAYDDLCQRAWEGVARAMKPSFDAMFTTCSTRQAKEIAHADKDKLGVSGINLTYGEVDFISLFVVLAKNLNLAPGGTFVDVGSGSGRGCMGAVLVHSWDRCLGIEIIPGLCDASQSILSHYTSSRSSFSFPIPNIGISGSDPTQYTNIEYINHDFRCIDWSDADVVFANSTCFDEQLMKDLAKQAQYLRQGAYVITLTKKIGSSHFRTIESRAYQMSWGLATVHTQIKVRPPKPRSTTSQPILTITPEQEIIPLTALSHATSTSPSTSTSTSTSTSAIISSKDVPWYEDFGFS